MSAEDPSALRQRLHEADAASAINAPGTKPWHLLATFQLYDDKGKLAETGTFEEWWTAPDRHKIVYTSPSYTNTYLRNEAGRFTTVEDAVTPEMLERLHDQIVHPFPPSKQIEDSVPYLEKKEIGKVPMDCIMVAQPLRNTPLPPLGLFPTYCFDSGKNSLRVSFDFGTMVTIRNQMGLFLGHSIAVDQSVVIGNITMATAHVEKLSTLTEPVSPELFDVSADMKKLEPATVQVAASVNAGNVISKINPIYPERAKQQRISGTVILHALIGTDGRIHSLRLVSTPDTDLAIAALAAVRQWIYKPYLLDKRPVSVDSTITVNFAFNHR